MKRLAAFAAMIACVAVVGAGSAAAEVTLKAVSFLPANHPVLVGGRMWVDEINAALKGELKVNLVGGPEIIPRFEQHEAIKNGVIGAGIIVAADLQDRVPEGMSTVLSKLSPSEERDSGYFDYLDALFQERLNTKLMGRVHGAQPFYLWFKDSAKSLAELKGRKMRTGSLYDRLMRHYGMIPVTMNSPEVYTALERGVVDGLGWPNIAVVKLGWSKHVKWVLDIPFFGASNMYVVMNLDSWNKLSPAAQKKAMEISAALEPKVVNTFVSVTKKEWQAVSEAGVKRFKFSDAENQEYLDTAYGLEWAELEKRLGKAETDKLKKMTGNL